MNNLWLKIKKKYRGCLLTGILVLFFLFGAIHIYNKPPRLEVDFLDVGQGDAALIKTPSGEIILIDGGPDNRVLRRLGENFPFYRRQIDCVILSHYHDDHAVGLIEIVRRYKVKNLIYAAETGPSPLLKELLATAQIRSSALLALTGQAQIRYGNDCFIDLLNPSSLGIKSDGNNSLVAKFNCNSQKFLFTGDNSSTVEKALVNSGWDLSATILKAAHHGSNSASSELFLLAVDPKLMVISVGADNKFGHPHSKILERMADLKINAKRTDKSGTVKIFSQ